MRRPARLGQPDIIDEDARGGDLAAAEAAKPVERPDTVEFFEPAAGGGAVEPGVRQRRQRRFPFGQQLAQRRAGEHPLGQQDLAGRDPRQIAGQCRLVRRHQRKSAGRQIEPGEADLAARLGDAGEIIIPARVEQTLLGEGPGGDDADHRAPHRPFVAAPPRLGRVLDLLADRHLEPGADQPGEIGLGSVDRHAAHRDIGAVVPAALGQGDIERCRRRDRVVEKHLEEIAHPEKQQAARVLRLGLMVLRHDRRGGRCLGGGGSWRGGGTHRGVASYHAGRASTKERIGMSGASPSAPTVREAVASFPDRAHFRAAVSALLAAGFATSDLSVLATHDSLAAAGAAAGSGAEAVPAGLSDEIKYIAPLTVAGIAVLSGGPIAAVVAALVAAGLGGAALKELFDDYTAPRHSAEFKTALDAGAALLWARCEDPEREAAATRILAEAGGHHVHVHGRPPHSGDAAS